MATTHNVQIRAPRFSQGGAGYVTADTIELTINGERMKNYEHGELFRALANLINTGNATRETLHALITAHMGYEIRF